MQLKFNFDEKRLIKETIIREYETYDTDGDRRIERETEIKKWFSTEPISTAKHNPTISTTYEVL
tara:strand:- start:319 stop:510 length:192 start_codon:yes stop_codon:yes gene_type:complete